MTGGRIIAGTAGAWLVFVVAHRLVSGRWWGWLLPDLLPPIAFVGVPLLLLALAPLARPWRRPAAVLATAGLALGAGLAGLNPHALAGPAATAPAGALRIVSWNTSVWNHRDPRPEEFFRVLRSYAADIYLLQEYKPFDEVTGACVDPGRLAREFPGYHITGRGELVTLSRLPVLATVALPVDPPADAGWQTDYWEVKALRTDLRVGSGTLSVYNVHMLVPLDLTSPLRRRFWQLRRDWDGRRQRQYAGLEADVRANPAPLVVAGDFNSSAAMGDLQPLGDRLTDVARANRSVYPTSWPLGRLPLWRVDWAFASTAVLAHRYELIDHSAMSDHALQDLTVSLAGPR